MSNYKIVYIDITNICNAKCPFCLTGNNKPAVKSFIEPQVFRQVLQKLIENKAVTESSVIHLYNWGEPFLHPKLSVLVEILNNMNLQFGLSTNASIDFDFPAYFFKNLTYLKFSLPGFSQDSYDKIHGLNFSRVIINIERMIKLVKKENPKTVIEINFHIYQFNLDEVEACRKFALKRKVHFSPYFAILNHWDNLNKYVHKSLPIEEMYEVAEKLFMYKINELRIKSPSSYVCPQYDLLVIDELGNVIACCQLPKEKLEYQSGNILEDEWETILKNKTSRPVCSDCIKSGLAYYINNSIITPDFWNINKINHPSIINLKKIIYNPITKLLRPAN